MMCFPSLKITVEPSQNSGRNKHVTEYKACTYHGAANTEYANECFMHPHYELWSEVVSLGYSPDKVLLGSCPRRNLFMELRVGGKAFRK